MVQRNDVMVCCRDDCRCGSVMGDGVLMVWRRGGRIDSQAARQ